MKFDWKYVLGTFLAIGGLFATIWYANIPPSLKSISLTVVSKSALNNLGDSNLKGLEVSFEGEPLESPYLTVLQLQNDGTVPIRSSDFESPINILFKPKVKLVRAPVVEVFPDWLKPKTQIEESIIEVQPLLLNPDEGLTISVLSDGFPGVIETQSRIAGIRSVNVHSGRDNSRGTIITYLMFGAAFIVAIPAAALQAKVYPWPDKSVRISRRTWMLAMIALGFTAVMLFLKGLDSFSVDAWWLELALVYLLLIVASPFAAWLNRGDKDVRTDKTGEA